MDNWIRHPYGAQSLEREEALKEHRRGWGPPDHPTSLAVLSDVLWCSLQSCPEMNLSQRQVSDCGADSLLSQRISPDQAEALGTKHRAASPLLANSKTGGSSCAFPLDEVFFFLKGKWPKFPKCMGFSFFSRRKIYFLKSNLFIHCWKIYLEQN